MVTENETAEADETVGKINELIYRHMNEGNIPADVTLGQIKTIIGGPTPTEIMEVITRECRDLLDLIIEKDFPVFTATPEERNQFIRGHFEMDMSGYGIPVEEFISGLTTEQRTETVNRILANPEYTE